MVSIKTVQMYVACILTEGLAVVSPTTAILTEAFLQYMEHKQLYPILMKYQIIGYFRYINILIMYNQKKINTDETMAEFIKQRTDIKFTIKKEQHNSISFLYLTVYRKRTKLLFTIYRKCTQSHIIISNDYATHMNTKYQVLIT